MRLEIEQRSTSDNYHVRVLSRKFYRKFNENIDYSLCFLYIFVSCKLLITDKAQIPSKYNLRTRVYVYRLNKDRREREFTRGDLVTCACF